MPERHPTLKALERALDEEEAWQTAEHRRLEGASFFERVGAGLSWPAMRVVGIAPHHKGCELSLKSVSPDPLHDGLGAGDAVTLGPLSGGGHRASGWVLDCDDSEAQVLVVAERWDRATAPAWVSVGHLELRRQLDTRTFERYRRALRRPGVGESPVGRALLSGPPEGLGSEMALEVCGHTRLNHAQQRAYDAVLNAPQLALVAGPPGTGKTHLMACLLAKLVAEGDRPWALADSNAATDHLALSAERAGLSVLRVGRLRRMGPSARHLSLDAWVERGPLGPALREIQQAIQQAHKRGGSESWRELRGLWAERRRVRAEARGQALKSAQVIASTFGTLATEAERLPAPHTALVDEATQAVEPAVWTAVPFIQRLVLVGDPHQLGPVVSAPGNALERSLLQRLVEEGHPLNTLEEQHRMSHAVQCLVSDVYGPSYHPHPGVANRHITQSQGVKETDVTRNSVLWIDTAGSGLEERRDTVSMSLYNEGELWLVQRVVDELCRAGVGAKDIAVIVPYSAQVGRLRKSLGNPEVEVATVNAYQGREKEVVVLSWVRSNSEAEVGFVADRRRLTVALTRARSLVVGVGDTATLGGAKCFGRLFEYLAEKGAMVSVWEGPWDAVLDAMAGDG